MEHRETKNLNNKSLQSELLKYKREYMNLRFQKALGNLSNVARIVTVKRHIAKILTIFNSR